MKIRIAAAGGLLVTMCTAAPGGDGSVRIRVIAVQDLPAPGTPPGVVFGRFSSPFNNTSPRPAIDDEGRQALFALLAGPGVVFSNAQGVWSEPEGVLELLARGGQPAPGTDALFSEFPAIEVPGEPIIRAGRTAFVATLTGPGVINLVNSHGIWSDRSGALGLVVRAGDPAPGLPAVTLANPQLAAFNAAGRTLIATGLAGAGVTADNDESIWSDRAGGFALLARESQPAPGTEPGVIFGFGQIGAGPSIFPRAVMNDASHVAFEATLAGPGITSFNDEALYLDKGQGPQILVREGEDAPGVGHNVTFGGNSVQLFVQIHSLTAAGQIAFSVRLGGVIPTTDAIFSTHTGVLTQFVRAGQPAPGTGTDFTLVGGARLSEAGRLAFVGSTATGFFPPSGVWWDQHGSIQPLLLPGAAPPGLQGAVVTGAGPIVGYAASGLMAVGAGLQDPIVGPQTALLLIEPDGAVHRVAASGELFDATGHGTFRTISVLTAGGLSETGELAFRIRFTDGTEGSYGAGLDSGCYPDCSGDGRLTVGDFGCFQTAFVTGSPYADCNGDGVLSVPDFGCFQTRFVAGCP